MRAASDDSGVRREDTAFGSGAEGPSSGSRFGEIDVAFVAVRED
jgi:hypothetical protein